MMTTWTDDKEQELFEAQETIAQLLEALGVARKYLDYSLPEFETAIDELKRKSTIEYLDEAIRKATETI